MFFFLNEFSSAFHVVELMDRNSKSMLGYGFELRELNMTFISVSTVVATIKYIQCKCYYSVILVLVSNTGLEDAGGSLGQETLWHKRCCLSASRVWQPACPKMPLSPCLQALCNFNTSSTSCSKPLHVKVGQEPKLSGAHCRENVSWAGFGPSRVGCAES